MKYPKNQFENLLIILKQFAVHFDLKSVNPYTLHYMVYQQLSEGQTHNHLYCIDASIKRYFQLTDLEKQKAKKLIENDFKFELYPIGCNDMHIETAVKKL